MNINNINVNKYPISQMLLVYPLSMSFCLSMEYRWMPNSLPCH